MSLSPLRPLPAFRKLLLPGASYKDRAISSVGASLGIGLTALACSSLVSLAPALPVLVASMGASAVLLFALPASPLAQPWPILGGNFISALLGVTAARLVPDLWLAAGGAVAAAILAMSLLRCLHPAGGATALLAVVGGPSVQAAGYMFAFAPVALNSLLLVMIGWLFHRFSGHSYPHRAVPMSRFPATVTADPRIRAEDIDAALSEMGEEFDVSREDLALLFQIAERFALDREAHSSG